MRAKAYAPGRVELLGNHTDYNEGVVLGAAIDRGLSIIGENREEDLITINSMSMGRAKFVAKSCGPKPNNRGSITPLELSTS